MSIETLLLNLTAALEANTAALGGKAATTSKASGTTNTGSSKPPANKPGTAQKKSPEVVGTLLNKIKEEFGKEHAVGVLNKGGLAKLSEVNDTNADKIYKLAKAAYDELQAGSTEEEEENDDNDI